MTLTSRWRIDREDQSQAAPWIRNTAVNVINRVFFRETKSRKGNEDEEAENDRVPERWSATRKSTSKGTGRLSNWRVPLIDFKCQPRVLVGLPRPVNITRRFVLACVYVRACASVFAPRYVILKTGRARNVIVSRRLNISRAGRCNKKHALRGHEGGVSFVLVTIYKVRSRCTFTGVPTRPVASPRVVQRLLNVRSTSARRLLLLCLPWKICDGKEQRATKE